MTWFPKRFTESAGKVRIECAACSRPMWFPKSKAHLYKTCGGGCNERYWQSIKGARARDCETCGKSFIPRPLQLAVGHGRVCSQKCNVYAHVAMNTQDAQKRAKEAWKARHAVTPIVKSGPANFRWKGGPRATYIRQRDKGNTREQYHRRRARTKEKLPSGFVMDLARWQRWRCAVCHRSIKREYEMDHVMPLALGGEHSTRNLQLLCRRCNRTKNAKDPLEFMQSRGFLC